MIIIYLITFIIHHNSFIIFGLIMGFILVKFNDHFDDLLEKGKIYRKSQLSDNNKKSIPNLTFWHQRYYYYSKYDEGIMMDNESN